MTNLFAGIPNALPEELTEIVAEHEHIRIERIVSHGHRSPDDFWYDQDEHEWVVLMAGRGRLVFADGRDPVTLGPGDCLAIKPHERHRVDWTEPNTDTVWLAVFYW